MRNMFSWTKCFSLLLVLMAMSSCAPTSPQTNPAMSRKDLAYLQQLQRDTWDYIDYFIAPGTGYPYDNNRRQGKTNTTNIGLYLASLCMAQQLGYVERSIYRTITDP